MEEVTLHKEREVGLATHLPRAHIAASECNNQPSFAALAAPNGLRRNTHLCGGSPMGLE